MSGRRPNLCGCVWLAVVAGLLIRRSGCRAGQRGDAGASPDGFPCCVSSLAVSISGWPRILPVRLESSFLRWRCAVRVNGMENCLLVAACHCQRGFCGHDWHTLRRGRDSCGWRGSRPFAPLAFFAAFQDDAPVFGHTRPAGLDPMLFQQFSNGCIGRIFIAQFHDGIMERLQIAEWNATWIGLIFPNCFAQRFKIERWCNLCVHNVLDVMVKS